MCYLMTIAIGAGSESLLDTFREAGFDVEQPRNVSLMDALGPDRSPFEITVGGCSCSIFTSPRSRTERPLRESFTAAVATAAERGGSVTLFVHWYSGDTATEQLRPRTGPSMSTQKYVTSARKLPKDTLVTVLGANA